MTLGFLSLTFPQSFVILVYGKNGLWSLALPGQHLITASESMIRKHMMDQGKVDIIQATPWISSPQSLPGAAPCLVYGTIPWVPHISDLRVSPLGTYCVDFLWVAEKSHRFPLLFSLNNVSLHGGQRGKPSSIQAGSYSYTVSHNPRVTMN